MTCDLSSFLTSMSVTLGRYEGDNERLRAMEICLQPGRILDQHQLCIEKDRCSIGTEIGNAGIKSSLLQITSLVHDL